MGWGQVAQPVTFGKQLPKIVPISRGQGRQGRPSSFACLCLKSSATSSNECTPSTNSSIFSNEASIHWSISTHTLSWCLYKCASCTSLFMLFIAATTFTLTSRSCIYEIRRQREPYSQNHGS